MTKAGRYERAAELPLMIAALAFLLGFAVPIIWWPPPPEVGAACEIVVWVTWGIFVVDYILRLALASNRGRYVLHHWFDLIVIALPVLRPLRLLRLVTFLSLINRRASSDLRGKVGLYVGCGSLLLAGVGALAVLDAERGDPAANITSIGDAAWWAITTMTTVGYGDNYPVTAIGRGVAVGLMVCGIAILGTVTATLASWIVERVAETSNDTQQLIDEVRALREEVATLRQSAPIPHRQAPLPDPTPSMEETSLP